MAALPAAEQPGAVDRRMRVLVKHVRRRALRVALHLPAALVLSAVAAGPAFAACDTSPRVNTAEAIAGDLQRSGCRNGDIATVRAFRADAAATLVRRVCAFNQQIVVIPREPRPPATIVDLLCVYAPR
jgi:hypothetical protein